MRCRWRILVRGVQDSLLQAVVGGAVVRNRVRRRLREIVRRHQHELRQGVWFVIIARYEAATASYDALEDEWLRLARRASILL